MSPESKSPVDAILLTSHGTISNTRELPDFLARIRRGRPVKPEFIAEIAAHYEKIGGSPLLAIARKQAAALEHVLRVPCHLAMRLWHPLVEDVALQIVERGQRRVLVLPLAPFSVDVYYQAARAAVSERGLSDRLALFSVKSWGSHPSFIAAWTQQIAPVLAQNPGAELILTAHSLPTAVILAGDGYEREVRACATAIGHQLGVPFRLAFQSQGVDGGDWIGPTLAETFEELHSRGTRKLVVAPIGFLSEHVETLYDLDIEAAALAKSLDLVLSRVPALDDAPALISTLVDVARESIREIE